MSANLWKVKAIKTQSTVLQGMEVEIIIKGRSGKPSISEIKVAYEQKYLIKFPGGCPESVFECKQG